MEVDVDSEAIELVAVDRPLDKPLDRETTLLLVDDKPVDREPIPVEVEVDSETSELDAVDRPVEVEVDRLLMAVLVANSCEPLIASVLVPVTRPAATLVTWRSAPCAPTLTTLVGVVPA